MKEVSMTSETRLREALDHIRGLSMSVPMAMNDGEGFYRSQVMEAIGTAQRAIDALAPSPSEPCPLCDGHGLVRWRVNAWVPAPADEGGTDD